MFNKYAPTPAGYDARMADLIELWKAESPGRRSEDVGESIGLMISQHLMLACKQDGQEECHRVLGVGEEGYWKKVYHDWLPEHHMRIVACAMLQLTELRPAAHAAAISRILTDLDRYLNTRERYVDVPSWIDIVVQMKK